MNGEGTVHDAAPNGFSLRFKRPLDAFTLEVDISTPAARVGVVGPSGSGKSTLVRVVAGVDRGALGSVEVGGRVWQRSDARVFVPAWRRGVGWVPQDVLLFPHLTVRQNLQFGIADGGSAEPAGLADMAEMLEITPLLERHSREISGGERQRVALGRALLASPGLLLLDEPFSALDADLRDRLAHALSQYVRDTRTKLLLVTHDRPGADALVQHWWTVSRGQLTAD